MSFNTGSFVEDYLSFSSIMQFALHPSYGVALEDTAKQSNIDTEHLVDTLSKDRCNLIASVGASILTGITVIGLGISCYPVTIPLSLSLYNGCKLYHDTKLKVARVSTNLCQLNVENFKKFANIQG